MEIVQRFQEGGVFMYPILAFGFFAAGVVIERAIQLYFKYKSHPADFRSRILEFVSRGDLSGAKAYAASAAPQSGISSIISTGLELRAGSGGEEELQARMDEKLTSEISKIDRRTGFLAMFGNVATLLGLLGTISGMIRSFAAVADASPVDRATMLSKGISEAMNCTAFGLIVAIPALIAYAIFQNKTDRIVGELTETTTEIYHDLLFMSEGPRPEKHLASSMSANGTAYTQAPSPSVSM
jgi:biopolymer transport protein ExbB/TolQ